MVKCSFCSRSAVYINRLSNVAYCNGHFIEHFERRVKKTIRKYGMFKPGDHIVVATSGGKDSLSLLHILRKISVKTGMWRVSALLIDEGIRGYREHTIRDFLSYVNRYSVPYRIVSFREAFGLTLDEMVELARERKIPYQPCSICGVFRRYLLNKVSREMGANVLATAHNLDDTVQTFLLNVIRNSWEKVVRQGPVTGVVSSPLFVKRVKPFITMLDKETTVYAIINNLISMEFHECPYIVHNIRFHIRRFINELEERYPGTKHMLLQSMLKIHSHLVKTARELYEGEVRKCIVCGEPSSHEICKACEYRFELGLMSREEEAIASRVLRGVK